MVELAHRACMTPLDPQAQFHRFVSDELVSDIGSDVGLSDDEFEALMAPFEPFEQAPRLGLGLSGGADSTALLHLALDWARRRGGTVVPLIIDHGLRSESTLEACAVADKSRALGLDPVVLKWKDDPPGTGVEAAARTARYALLSRACEAHRLLHLLVGHHRDDQIETIAMRQERSSGFQGLAGMSACVERRGYRLLRPLLSVPKARLLATLQEDGHTWFEDPMNRDERFARARMRRDGITAGSPAATFERIALERELEACLPSVVRLDRFGEACLDRSGWRALPRKLADLVVARLARTMGGLDHAPASRRVEAMAGCLRGDNPVKGTLGRCLWRGRDTICVSREMRDLPVLALDGPETRALWDGRFEIAVPDGVWIVKAWSALTDHEELSAACAPGLSPSALQTLPVIGNLEGRVMVPHLEEVGDGGLAGVRAVFAPRQPLTPPRFVSAGESGMSCEWKR